LFPPFIRIWKRIGKIGKNNSFAYSLENNINMRFNKTSGIL